jgi:hypothetical protein
MAGTRTNPTNVTPNFWAQDWNQTIATLLGNDAAIVQMLFGNAKVLVSGAALTAGAGMGINVAAALATANGVLLPISAGTVTLAAGNTQPRYDVIYALLGTTADSNGTSGQPTTTDSYTLGVLGGIPSGSPAVPLLANANYVQLGTVLVPANATTATACTLNSQVTAPNAQGPLKTLVDLLVHIAATATTSTTVHGIRQGSGNAFDADTVDGIHAAGFDAAGTAATQVATEAATRAAADTTQATNLTTHTGTSARTATGVHGVIVDSGGVSAQSVGNQGNVDYAVTFNYTQPDTNYRCVPVPTTSTPFTLGFGGFVQVWGKTTTGCTVRVMQNSGAAQTIGLDWILVR